MMSQPCAGQALVQRTRARPGATARPGPAHA